MLRKHKSNGLIDLIKLTSSTFKKETAKPLQLENRMSLNKRSSNMFAHSTEKNKFNAETFNNKFNQLGRDIVSMELKTKN